MILENKQNTTNYVLINLLESFDKQELKHFGSFINSTYFNKDKQVLALYEALEKFVIGKKPFDEQLQTKVFLFVFKMKFNKGVLIDKAQKKLLWVKLSQLGKLAKQFLIVEGLEGNPAFKTSILNQQLTEKKQFPLLQQELNKAQKYLIKQSNRTTKASAHGFEVEMGKMNLLHHTGLLLKADNFPAVNRELDFYYLIHKLKLWSTMQSMQSVRIDKVYDFDSMEAIFPLLELAPHKETPLIVIFRAVIKLLKTNEESDFYELLKLFDLHKDTIAKEYFIDFYAVACNFCAGQFRAGKEQYNQEILALYKQMDAQDLLKIGDFIEVNNLKNIITASCYVEEFEWAILIIHKYISNVRKAVRDSVLHYNLGVVAFYKGLYKEAISHLIRVEKVNLVYDLDSRILLLKAYYQMDERYDERTIQIFRATEKAVMTKPIPASHKKSYKNFVQLLINLYRIRHQVGKKTLDAVERKMALMNSIVAKKWLLDKIAEINLKE